MNFSSRKLLVALGLASASLLTLGGCAVVPGPFGPVIVPPRAVIGPVVVAPAPPVIYSPSPVYPAPYYRSYGWGHRGHHHHHHHGGYR